MLKLEGLLTSPPLVCSSTNQETEVQSSSFPKAKGCQNMNSYTVVLVCKSMHYFSCFLLHLYFTR